MPSIRAPADLALHAVVAYSYFASGDDWHFDGPRGPVNVKIDAWMHTNNGDTCRAAALAHQGIILQPTFLVAQDLAAGTLVELIPAFRSPSLGIYAVYPTRKHVSPKVRALIDFLADRFAHAAW